MIRGTRIMYTVLSPIVIKDLVGRDRVLTGPARPCQALPGQVPRWPCQVVLGVPPGTLELRLPGTIFKASWYPKYGLLGTYI